MMNVKGTDLLSIDQMNERKNELDEIRPVYEQLGIDMKPFQHVKYFILTARTRPLILMIRQVALKKGFL